MRCEIISWRRFQALCRRLAYQVRAAGFSPDLIVAIARGGYMPARLLSDYLGLMDLASFRIEHYRAAHKQPVTRVTEPLSVDTTGRRVLLVDDVSDTGDTFQVALDHLRSQGDPTVIKTVVMHHKITSAYVPDFYAAKVVKWRWLIYPWALMEDLTGMIGEMGGRAATPDDLVLRLQRDHGMRVSRQGVEDALAFMDHAGEVRPS